VIVSASSRTDIPAFYGDWFRARLDAGYCISANPFSGRPYRVSLRRNDVDGFYFWTKNLGPFLPQLAVLRDRGFPFVIHYTINNYPHSLEPAIPRVEAALSHGALITRLYGVRALVWRYDPILITSETDFDFHRRNFTCLARALAGTTGEVTVAYASFAFRKTRVNLTRLQRRIGLTWRDPEPEQKQDFLCELSAIAAESGMTLRLCGQREYLREGIAEAVCIDAERLSQVAGRAMAGSKPGHRGKECACDYSRDIGAYDTCLHGCAYCYAVSDPRAARRAYQEHDPAAEWLRSPPAVPGRERQPELPLSCLDRPDLPTADLSVSSDDRRE
jgi:hypothetical protein